MGVFLRNFLLFILLSVPSFLLAQYSVQKINPDSVVTKFERQLYSIDPEKGDLIPVYFVQLDDLFLRLDTLKNLNIGIDSIDKPIKIRLKKARIFYDSVKPVILEKMQKIDLVIYEEALKAKTNKDTNRASTLFIKSLQHNPFYGPAAYELIRINLTPEKYTSVIQYFENYSSRIDSISNPYYFNLIKDQRVLVLDNVIAYSSKIIASGIPADALKILKEAEYFQNIFPSPAGKEKIKLAYSAAHTGMYNSLVLIADRAKSARKFELARHYYQQAQSYQQSYPDYVAENIPQKIEQDKSLSESEKLFLLERHPRKPKFEHKRRKMIVSRQEKPSKKSKPQLIPAQETTYDTLIRFYTQMADSFLFHKQYYTAIQCCDSVKYYSNKGHIKTDTTLEYKYASAARTPLLDSIHSAYFVAWKNEIEKANQSLLTAQKLQIQYFLTKDLEVSSAIDELKQRIHERKCFSAKSDYEASVYRALSQFIRSNYLEGKDFLNKALSIYSNNKDCGFSDSLLTSTEIQYNGLIQWQEHWMEAKQALSVKDYKTFYIEYDSCYAIYLTNKLEQKGLTFKPLVKYIEDQKDMEVCREVTRICISSSDLTKSWQLLQLLKANAVKGILMDELLTEVGKQMRLSDKSSNSQYWLYQLKSGGPWFRKAKKAYFRSQKNTKN